MPPSVFQGAISIYGYIAPDVFRCHPFARLYEIRVCLRPCRQLLRSPHREFLAMARNFRPPFLIFASPFGRFKSFGGIFWYAGVVMHTTAAFL